MATARELPAAGLSAYGGLIKQQALQAATAAMAFSGPLVKETQQMRHVPIRNEYESFEFLQGGVYGKSGADRRAGMSQEHFGGGVAGDCSKFKVGFFRSRAAEPQWEEQHKRGDEAGCAKSYARDNLRASFISSNQRRSGFNPITGAEEAPVLDGYKPRGRV